jgi:hypothetical protein
MRGLGAAFYINLRIAQRLAFAPYFHFDLNAGCGINAIANSIGSPLAFMRAVADAGHGRAVPHFVDRDGDALRTLMARAEMHNANALFFHGDNASFIDLIPALIEWRGERPAYALGSVLCDPNGADIPFDALAALFARCPRLDVIVNWAAATHKRVRCHPHLSHDGPRIDDLPRLFGKRHWLVRQPSSPYQFTLLIGRNVETDGYAPLGFYKRTSAIGEAIVARCDLTRSEWATAPGQMGLF